MDSKALLPTGFYDLLPPYASFEAHLLRQTMACLQRFGYARVSPPMLEFEESLLNNHFSSKMDQLTFRVMDPASQQLMGLRADMTMQIGRIALTRLSDAPRPLRLCYSGSTVITKASAINPSRQFRQAGAELIGVDTAEADAEAIIIAVTCLQQVGVKRITVDLNLPRLTELLLQAYDIVSTKRSRVLTSLAHKAVNQLDGLPEKLQRTLVLLTEHTGPVQLMLPKLLSLELPQAAESLCQRLADVVEQVQAAIPDVNLTLDATEMRGYEYHNGISFSLFAAGIEGEIGRGGRYLVAFDRRTAAIGFTVYINQLLPILPVPPQPAHVLVPAALSHAETLALQAEGYMTVRDIAEGATQRDAAALAEVAQSNHCHFYWWDGQIHPTPNTASALTLNGEDA